MSQIMRDLFKISFKKGKNLANFFPGPVFWDIDPSKLDVKNDKSFIIERVLSQNMGNQECFKKLDELYSKGEIIKYAKRSNQIRGNNSIRAIADYYHIDPSQLKNFNPSFG